MVMENILREQVLPGGQKIQVARADLTEERVDAIVNAANSQLQHGGGLAAAIVRKGGPEIQEESDAWVRQYGPVAHDTPAYTRAGNLPARYVIHAVGPVWGEGDEDAKLAGAVSGALRVADWLALESVALPAISTGIFGFPKERAAGVILTAIRQFFALNPAAGIKLVRLALFDQPTLDAFLKEWDQIPWDKG
jgi:O-acetyl-ADP-ribose deacetylase (regulator of RNase III)